MSILDQHGHPMTPQPDCTHDKHMPDWPGDAAVRGMSAHDIRRLYPRFSGRCDDCGVQVILYATSMQYTAGDY